MLTIFEIHGVMGGSGTIPSFHAPVSIINEGEGEEFLDSFVKIEVDRPIPERSSYIFVSFKFLHR